MHVEEPVFRIIIEQGQKNGMIETDDAVSEKLETIIKMYGGRQCHAWNIPASNHKILQQELLKANKNVKFNVQSINAPILKLSIKNGVPIAQKDIFTIGLESSMEDYVWISTKSKIHYHQDDKIYETHKSVQQSEILPEKRFVPISFYKSCIRQLQTRHPNDIFEETPSLQKMMEEYTTIDIDKPDIKAISCFSIKTILYADLLPHQKACIAKGVKLNGQILIADEAGLGKTFSSLALASVYSHTFPLLIICTKWMRVHWEEQIIKWLGEVSIYKVPDGSQDIKISKVTIISYQQCSKLIKKLKQQNYQICIADESQTLKNGSEIAQACQDIFDQCQYKIFLSGAPVMSKPSELITQLEFICHQKVEGFSVFTKNQDLTETLDPTNSKNCHEYLQKYYLARTSKNDCKEVPHLNRYVVKTPVDESFKKQKLKQSYKQLGRAKLSGILSVVQELLVQGEKILFFAFHKQIIYDVEQLCQDLSMKFIKIDGTRIECERNEDIKKFQENSEIRIAILSFKSASTGIGLTEASSIVFGEMYFSDQSVMLQSEGRAHRLGQKQILDCYYLVGDCQQDRDMFKDIKKNYFEFSEFLNGTEEEFEATEISFDEFYKLERHLSKQKQPKLKVEKINETTKMITRSAFQKKLNQAFEQIKNRTYLTQTKPITKEKPIMPVKKNIKKQKSGEKKQKQKKVQIPEKH